jgi:hypothetical protein
MVATVLPVLHPQEYLAELLQQYRNDDLAGHAVDLT